MIPLGAPEVSEDAIDDVLTLLERGDLSTGEVVADFEAAFSDFGSREYGVAVASGSVALELALEATFDDGASVAISPYNCGAVLYSVLRSGLTPVFVDADPTTAAIDPNELRDVGTDLDGVLLAHLFGHPADVAEIRAVADTLDATLIEDFAQAPGATFDDEVVGSVGTASICSFGATKNLTTAEGGIVVTDDEVIADYVAEQRSNTDDVTPSPRSVRMNDIEAALGLSQLETYDEILDRKRSVAAIYRTELENIEVETPSKELWATHVYHAFPVLHPDADALAAHLEAEGIGTSRLYDVPLHEYEAAPATGESYPVAERLSEQVVLLPIHGQVTDAEARTVARAVERFCTNQ